MSPRSIYIIGGSGAGKSTALQRILDTLNIELGEFEDLWAVTFTNRKIPTEVTLRGHRFPGGVYLGLMRDEFPGADGLDNASGPVFRDWLVNGELPPELIIGEGLVFSSFDSMIALHEATDLVVLYLHEPEDVIAERQERRKHKLSSGWVSQTHTRAANLAAKLRSAGVTVVENDVEAALLHAAGV